MTVPLHTFNGRLVFGQTDETLVRTVEPRADVRMRLVNTDQVTHVITVTGTAFRVLAIDGTDVGHPSEIEGVAVSIPAGGPVDLGFTMPEAGVTVTDWASRTASIGLVPGEGDEPPAPVIATASSTPSPTARAPRRNGRWSRSTSAARWCSTGCRA